MNNTENLYFFHPGKRENAFYTKQKLRYTDRFGLQSEQNDGFFIYEAVEHNDLIMSVIKKVLSAKTRKGLLVNRCDSAD